MFLAKGYKWVVAKALLLQFGKSKDFSLASDLLCDVGEVFIKTAHQKRIGSFLLGVRETWDLPRLLIENVPLRQGAHSMDQASSQDRLLSFPAATFSKLCPLPFLQAHVSKTSIHAREFVRPNGRRSQEMRPLSVNIGSLSNACGSAVVRTGETTVVCGVRAEVLSLEDVPNDCGLFRERASEQTDLPMNPAKNAKRTPLQRRESTCLAALNLLVPNVELATGCAPAHLPNSPPSTSAQSLSHRIMTLLSSSDIIRSEDLQILSYEKSKRFYQGDPELEEASLPLLCAFWTLYIDILFISLDGNAFDTAWTAVVAALRDTRLPTAWFDPDTEQILCSNTRLKSKPLRLRSYPLSTTIVMLQIEKATNAEGGADGLRKVLLADPDEFEEELSQQTVTVVVSGPDQVIKIECGGLGLIAMSKLKSVVRLAGQRWTQTMDVIGIAGGH